MGNGTQSTWLGLEKLQGSNGEWDEWAATGVQASNWEHLCQFFLRASGLAMPFRKRGWTGKSWESRDHPSSRESRGMELRVMGEAKPRRIEAGKTRKHFTVGRVYRLSVGGNGHIAAGGAGEKSTQNTRKWMIETPPWGPAPWPSSDSFLPGLRFTDSLSNDPTERNNCLENGHGG